MIPHTLKNIPIHTFDLLSAESTFVYKDMLFVKKELKIGNLEFNAFSLSNLDAVILKPDEEIIPVKINNIELERI